MKEMIFGIALFFALLLPRGLMAKTIVVSDIDDTIKRSNVLNLAEAARRLFEDHPPFHVVSDIYRELAKDSATLFVYVSASTPSMYNAQKWVIKKRLPQGQYFQRSSILVNKRTFKQQKIFEFLQKNYVKGDRVLFFGDNAEIDPSIYLALKKKMQLNAHIFIRDIRMNVAQYCLVRNGQKFESVNYFGTGLEILSHNELQSIKDRVYSRAKKLAIQHKLFASYQVRRLARQFYRCYRQFACRPIRRQKTLEHIQQKHQEIFALLEAQ